MIIHQLHFPEIRERWEEISEEMGKPYRYSSANLTTDDLYNSLLTGGEYLWEVTNDSGENKGFGTTDYLCYNNGNIIARVTSLTGSDMKLWFSEAIKVFEIWAQSIGAYGIEIWGRKGFQKFLADENYEMSQQLYVKRLSNG